MNSFRFRRTASLALVAFGLSLHAQSWDALGGLKQGDRVKVLDSTGQEHEGAFRAVSADAVALEDRTGEVSIEKTKVRRVQVRANRRRARNLLIGAAIGVAVGVTVDTTLGAYFRNETGETGGARALTYIAPTAIFGGIAAALPAYATVYRSR
jgi:hypothetical protein